MANIELQKDIIEILKTKPDGTWLTQIAQLVSNKRKKNSEELRENIRYYIWGFTSQNAKFYGGQLLPLIEKLPKKDTVEQYIKLKKNWQEIVRKKGLNYLN